MKKITCGNLNCANNIGSVCRLDTISISNLGLCQEATTQTYEQSPNNIYFKDGMELKCVCGSNTFNVCPTPEHSYGIGSNVNLTCSICGDFSIEEIHEDKVKEELNLKHIRIKFGEKYL